MIIKLLFSLVLGLSAAYAQDSETIGIVEIDLADKCQKEIQKIKTKTIKAEQNLMDCSLTASETVDDLVMDIGDVLFSNPTEVIDACSELADFKDLEEMKIDLPSDEKAKRNVIVRFTSGLKTVPHNVKTDMNISTASGNHQIKDFVMKYDTRWQHLNPGNWNSFESATNFLHESTWGYQVDVLVEGKNKKRTGFSLFLDHPKFKGAMAQDAQGNYSKVPTIENRNFGDTSAYERGSTVYHVQNSHMNIIGGLKVSRELWVKEFRNGGRLSYNVNAGAGANIGISRTVETKVLSEEKGGYWKSQVGKVKVQGYTAMVGHGIEYEKGNMAVGLTNTLQYSKIKQDYLDGGYAQYSLPHATVALTVSVNVFNAQNKKEKKKKKAEARSLN